MGKLPGASLIDPSTAMTESNMLPLPFPVQGSLHPRVLSYISSSLCSSSEIASNCRSSCRQQHHQPLHPHYSLSVLLLLLLLVLVLVLVLVLIMALEAVLATSSPAALLGRAVHRGPGQMAIGGCPGPPWAAHWHERHARASMLHHRRVVHLRWVTPRVALHARAAVHGWRRCKHDAARRHELHALGHLARPHGYHLRRRAPIARPGHKGHHGPLLRRAMACIQMHTKESSAVDVQHRMHSGTLHAQVAPCNCPALAECRHKTRQQGQHTEDGYRYLAASLA